MIRRDTLLYRSSTVYLWGLGYIIQVDAVVPGPLKALPIRNSISYPLSHWLPLRTIGFRRWPSNPPSEQHIQPPRLPGQSPAPRQSISPCLAFPLSLALITPPTPPTFWPSDWPNPEIRQHPPSIDEICQSESWPLAIISHGHILTVALVGCSAASLVSARICRGFGGVDSHFQSKLVRGWQSVQ